MSSACTPQRLICNITSCFFARRLRLEEKPDAFIREPPEMPSGSIVFDFTGGGGGRRAMRINGGEAEPEPHIEEEDYLVFCFGEDGTIDIVNDDEEEKEEESRVTADTVALHKVSEDDEIKETQNSEAVEQKTRSLMEHFEACDSSLSDTSSGSFAFPILKMEEWVDSPVYMPKQENQGVRLQCCRF